jgi:LPXTG-motif cell wall-anchored protein
MRGRLIAAVLLGLLGLAWAAQGLGLLPGTGAMDGDIKWTFIGAGMIVVAVVLGLSARRRTA